MAPIEYLQQFANIDIDNEKNIIDYNNYLYFEHVKDMTKDKYGIQTTGLSKPLIVGCLVQFINENPKAIKSSQLIDQFSSIEKTSSGSIKSSGYSDLFMASGFCALVRNKKAMEILPLIESKSVNLQGKDFLNQYTEILNIGYSSKSKKITKLERNKFEIDYSDEEIMFTTDNIEDFYRNDNDIFGNNEEESFIPFFTE